MDKLITLSIFSYCWRFHFYWRYHIWSSIDSCWIFHTVYFLIKKKRKELNAQGSKAQPSLGVVYEEINSAVSTTSKPIELQDNAAYGRMQSHQ